MIQGTMWQELDGFRREMESIFNGLASTSYSTSPLAKIFSESNSYHPDLHVREDDEAVYVEAAVPGVDPQSLDISIEHNTLTLSGEKSRFVESDDTEVFRRQERSAGQFARTLNLPSEIDPEQVSAECTHGVLRVTLPKAEKAKPKRIIINTA